MTLSDSSLGRSLKEVFEKTVRREPSAKGYFEVDIDLIQPPALYPRQHFDAQAQEELSASVRQHGILQPLVVMKRASGYEIISGERRYRAAKQAGLIKVPVVIREENNPQHLAELRIIENIQRENLNPIELAQAYQALIDQHGLTHEALAERLNKERSTITNCLRTLTLNESIQQWLSQGLLSLGHAKVLLGLTPDEQTVLAQQILDEGLSVRATEERLKRKRTPTAAPAVSKSSGTKEIEDNLFRLFGTRVVIKDNGGKGTMTLHFASRDHFQRVVAVMDRIIKQAQVKEDGIK